MKRYAIADGVPYDCDYLTAGKEYEVSGPYSYGGWIKSDDDYSVFISFTDSDHLDGNSWRIVERES